MRIRVLAASLTLVACASPVEKQSIASAPVQTPGPATAAAASATDAPPAAQLASAPDGAVVDPTAEFQPPPGYKRRPDMGENIYCSKIVVLGSRFPKQDCRTEQELRDLQIQRETARGEFEQRNKVCASNNGACGGT